MLLHGNCMMKCPNDMTLKKMCKNLAGFNECDIQEPHFTVLEAFLPYIQGKVASFFYNMYSILEKKSSHQKALNPDTCKHLPFDLIVENILPRLPMRSLTRLSITSKTWYSAIKSPQFIANYKRFRAKDQYLLIIDKTCQILDSQTLVEIAKFDFDLVPNDRNVYCAESCNGLFLLQMYTKFFLWNPSVRKSRELDTSFDCTVFNENGTAIYPHMLHGLGFNESCNDHRVVTVSYFLDNITGRVSDIPTKVDIYSLSTNSWRRVKANPGQSICIRRGVYLNGAFHWFANTESSTPGHAGDSYLKSILLFDFEEECFREMALPSHLSFSHNELSTFQEFQGSLAALFNNFFESEINDDKYDVWVMTEYGVANSWTKKFTIRRDWDYPIERWLIGFTKRGDFIWMEYVKDENGIIRDDDVLLTIEDGKYKRKIEGRYFLVQVVDFMKSSVLL